jgi:thymidylate synthase (FAD)
VKAVEMKVTLVAKTTFCPPNHVPWDPDTPCSSDGGWGGSELVEFAGRACYQSWSRPNPATATNSGYLKHILQVKHLSVLEHGSASFYIEGVSRSLTHELVRHRHLSYSQLSQRYVPDTGGEVVVPRAIQDDSTLLGWFEAGINTLHKVYRELLPALAVRFLDVGNPTHRRKLARQTARALLPNATETKIVVTGNYRAWRHFLKMRATEHADVEIRALAVEILRQLWHVAPAVFCDFEIFALDDGTEIATSSIGDEEE